MDPAELLLHLTDRTAIVDTILRFAHAFDIQDWALLRSCLADVVEVDYSDLRGEPTARVGADEYVSSRARGLEGLRTQHMSTNHLVHIDGDHAECTSCFLIHRLDPGAADGGNTFDSAGHYVHRLRRGSAGWQIDAIKQAVLWNRGNPEVHGALRRGRSSP